MAESKDSTNDSPLTYTFSPNDDAGEEKAPGGLQGKEPPEQEPSDLIPTPEGTPLFSTLIPNLGTGLVTLSRPGSTPGNPINLPPPRRAAQKPERNRPPQEPPAPKKGKDNREQTIPPPGKKGKGGKAQKARMGKDDLALYPEMMADQEGEGLFPPAYVDTEAETPAARPRLCRPQLRGTDPQVLCTIAEGLGLALKDYPTPEELADKILQVNETQDGGELQTTYGDGVLQIGKDGYGHLRAADLNYQESPEDIYITPMLVKRYSLRVGDCVLGTIRHPKPNDPRSAMVQILAVNGLPLSQRHGLRSFESLTPYYPTQRLLMERGKDELSMRVVDLITPIGRGQRGLIVAQPRTGKTIILQKLANSILENNDDITLIVLLIDERPEEVTDMKRVVNAEIVASTFDEPPEHHASLCELVSERAKRLVENGKHVVILLDSITRLARAYNTLAPKSGRILSGGLDANALFRPKRFFGSARNIEGGGSLTILATALIDTGSRMDELIFEEFKGTGNMELHLDRQLADKRVFPAIDITKSGTRKEDLLVDPDELELMWALRKGLCSIGDPANAMERLLINLRKYGTNVEFLLGLFRDRQPQKAEE